MRDDVSLGDGVLITDDTGIPKQGEHSVGVARQYCSELGKVANCQVVVTLHYADPAASWPVNARLYLPAEWTDDPERMKKAGVPEDIEFQSKPEIALSLLDEANEMGIPHEAVVSDASYGGNDTYLSGLEERGEHYVNGVPCDFPVIVAEDPEASVQRADAVMHGIPRRRWETIHWREGTKGWLGKKFVAVRAYRTVNGEVKKLGWLIGERPGYGKTGEWKYYFSNFPADAVLAKLVDYAHRRWYIDRFYEDAKNELGMGDYQGRKWIGFQRHMVIVMLTYRFLAWSEWKHRQSTPRSRGRPRDPFSPRIDKRRLPMQEIHRQVIDALWIMAVEYHLRIVYDKVVLVLLCQLEHIIANLLSSGSRKTPFYAGLSVSYCRRGQIHKSALQAALRLIDKVIIGLGVGFALGDRSKSTIWNLVTGVIGAVLGGAAFEYILRDHYSPFVNMYKWGPFS
jgi:SRSO17 transposase